MDKRPTNCQQCNVSLSDRPYIYMYRDDKIIGAYCCDCDDKNIMDTYLKTKVLRTRLIERISLDLCDVGRAWAYWEPETRKYKNKKFNEIFFGGIVGELQDLQNKLDIWISNAKIHEKIKEFEKEVWFNGLQKIIQKSESKGVSAELPSIKCLIFSMCARTMITIESETASVTMMCEEDSHELTMGFRGIDATEQQALALITLIIDSWKSGYLVFKDDNKVSYCGI